LPANCLLRSLCMQVLPSFFLLLPDILQPASLFCLTACLTFRAVLPHQIPFIIKIIILVLRSALLHALLPVLLPTSLPVPLSVPVLSCFLFLVSFTCLMVNTCLASCFAIYLPSFSLVPCLSSSIFKYQCITFFTA